MLVVRARKSEESEMKLECLTPEFPQGARVYSVDGVEHQAARKLPKEKRRTGSCAD